MRKDCNLIGALKIREEACRAWRCEACLAPSGRYALHHCHAGISENVWITSTLATELVPSNLAGFMVPLNRTTPFMIWWQKYAPWVDALSCSIIIWNTILPCLSRVTATFISLYGILHVICVYAKTFQPMAPLCHHKSKEVGLGGILVTSLITSLRIPSYHDIVVFKYFVA